MCDRTSSDLSDWSGRPVPWPQPEDVAIIVVEAAQRRHPLQPRSAAFSGSAVLAPWTARRRKHRGRAPRGQRVDTRPEDVGVHGLHVYADNIEGPSRFLFWASTCQPAPHEVFGIDINLLHLERGLDLSEWTYRRYVTPKLFHGIEARHPMLATAHSSIATLTRRAVAVAAEAWAADYLLEVTGPEYSILLR